MADSDPDHGGKDLLVQAQAAYQLAYERERRNRDAYQEDVRFARLAEQWPEAIRRQRELDGRPCLTINRLPAFIRQVVNSGRQNKPAIKVHPAADGADQATAEILNDLIRNIEVTSNADVAYDTALECAVTGGFGYLTVSTEYADDEGFELELRINTVADPMTIYGDPYSLGADSADWTSAFETEWVSADELKRRFPRAECVSWDDFGTSRGEWRNDDGKRLLLAKWWRREATTRTVAKLSNGEIVDAQLAEDRADDLTAAGLSVVGEREVPSHKVTWTLLTGAEVLKTGRWGGRYIPIVPVYGDTVVVDGERHLRSMIRDARDPQQMFNFWRTASTELVALAPKAPFIGRLGAFKTDKAKWETANTDSHAYIEYDGPEMPQRQAFAGVPAGALQEASNAADDLAAIVGLQGAAMGITDDMGEMSGRAILGLQKRGDVSTFHFVDNMSRSIRHAGRILLDLIPSVYSGPRVLRVLGQDGKAAMQPVNQPTTVAAPAPNGATAMVERIYDLTAGRYDLVVEPGPSYATQREEEAQQMLTLVQADPMLAGPLAPIIARNLDWHGADEIVAALQGAQQGAQQSAPPVGPPQGQAPAGPAPFNPQAVLQAQAQRQAGELQLAAQRQAADLQLAREKQAAEIQMQRENAAAALQLKQRALELDYALKRQQLASRAGTGPTAGDDLPFGGAKG